MSKSTTQSDGEEQVRQLLRESFDPWEKSAQAVFHGYDGRLGWDEITQRHNDGERMYKDFGLTPFYKVLQKAERRNHPIYRFPSAYLDSIIHLDDSEKWALESGDLDALGDVPRTRRLVLEWLAENPDVLAEMSDGGTDIHGHSKPGKGKTSFANILGTVRNTEINNETVLWMLTLDELECLPVAPYMTLLAPAGVAITAEAVPVDPSLPSIEVGLDDVFRDVVRYENPTDVWETVVPGGIYGVLPDPGFRKCEQVTTCSYNRPDEADEPAEVTPLRDWIHAAVEVRAKDDVFLHRTTMIIDEMGDLLPKNPRADASDTYRKVDRWPATYGKARKKNLSVMGFSHSLKRIHEDVLEKERWFATFPKTPTPGDLAGVGDVALPDGYTNSMNLGEAAVWNSTNYAPISWTNPYRTIAFNGEISLSYPRREEALDAV